MVRFENNAMDFAENLEGLCEKARYVLTGQVRDDCNYYARKASGDLINSTLRAPTDLSKGKIVWDMPYAAQVYFHGTPNTTKNPNASLMWCQKAIDSFSKDWLTISANYLKKELQK